MTGHVAEAVAIPALILLSCTLEFHLSVAGIVFGWVAYPWSIIVFAVATTAYLADAYPSATAEISGLLTAARTLSGFTVGYSKSSWRIESNRDS